MEASPTEPTGLFSFDTRFLSKWVLTIDGQKLNSLSIDDLQYFQSRFFLVPGTGTVYIDAKLSVIRERSVGDGFHEELTILNHENEPVELDGPDRRGQRLRRPVRGEGRAQEGRRLRVADRGRPAAPPVHPRDVQARDGHLRLGTGQHRRGRPDLRRPGRAARQLDDGSRRGDVTRPAAAARSRGRSTQRGRKRARPNMERSLERWIEDAPRLECDIGAADGHVPAQPGRPGRAPLLAAGRRRQEPAGRRTAVVHDDVRPRQHLHQPPVAALHARAGGHDPAGARRLAGQST